MTFGQAIRTRSASHSTSSAEAVEQHNDSHKHIQGRPPVGLAWRSSTLFIILVVGVGIFTDLFIYTIIVPVLPFVLRDRIGIPESELQLNVSILLGIMAAASFVFSPVAGVITDKVGNRQQPFLMGLVAMLFSTVLLAFGRTVPAIAIARILQGISSAVVWVVGLAICLETVGPSRLGTVIATVCYDMIMLPLFFNGLIINPDLQLRGSRHASCSRSGRRTLRESRI